MTHPTNFPSPQDQRFHAVLALLHGEPAKDVTARYGIGRSALYKFRRRALEAVRAALVDHPRGPKRPHNHLDDAREQRTVSLCQRYPAFSSYRMARRFGQDTPSPRTIQRIRKRHNLARVTKRAPPESPSRKMSPRAAAQARALLHEKPYLGPDRLAWDLWNGQGIRVSASTFKRYKRKWRELMRPAPSPLPVWRFYERHHPHSLWHGDFLEKVTLADLDQTAYHFALMDDYSRGYVFCDLILNPDLRTTIRAIIVAMRRCRVIPEAILFDNGSAFKGKLLSEFCERVGIRLIHSSVNHPQTNGKLERAFRDDMRDFYRQRKPWLLEPLRRELPAYVHYRNHVRGHQALGGKPSIVRLNENHGHAASPDVLDRLESFACYETGRRILSATGGIRMLGRDAYVGEAVANAEVVFSETLEGLEARVDGQPFAVLRDYRTLLQRTVYRREEIPPVLRFEPCAPVDSPRIAVASGL